MKKKDIQATNNLNLLGQARYTKTDFISEQTAIGMKELRSKGTVTPFTRKFVRQNIKKAIGYQFGNLGASNVANMPSRKERRKMAKEQGVNFSPVYNN